MTEEGTTEKFCKRCVKEFKTERLFQIHEKECMFHNIHIFCKKCNNILTVKEVKKHPDLCEGESGIIYDDWKVKSMELAQEKKKLIKENTQMKEEYNTLQTSYELMHTELKWVKIQSNLFAELIRQNTSIPVDDLITISDNSINIHNYENGNIPIIVHDVINSGKKPKIKKYKIVCEKKPLYRSVNNQTTLEPEKPLESKIEKIREVDSCVEKILDEKFESKEDVLNRLDKVYKKLPISKSYTRLIGKIPLVRRELLGLLPLDEYLSKLKTDKDFLETLLKDKKLSKKQYENMLKKAFTPLDRRFLFYSDFYNTSVEADDLEKFKLCLETREHYRTFIPMNTLQVYNYIKNYGLALFPIEIILSTALFNRYGFHNIVYFSFKKSNKSDPFSFYTLESIKDNKRFWKMDCRLENFSNDIMDVLRNYCVYLFRKIYASVFKDNDYRKDWRNYSTIFSEDVSQLIDNIRLLCYPKAFINFMRNLVIKHATLIPTELDKCRFVADDEIQKQRLKSMQDTDEDVEMISKQLFDRIEKDNMKDILNF